MEGSSDTLSVLIPVFCCFALGGYGAFMLCDQMAWRYVLLIWIGAAAGWYAILFVIGHFAINAGLLGGLFAFYGPVVLAGAAIGALVGLISFRDF